MPMVRASSSLLQGIDPNTLVQVFYAEDSSSVPYLIVHSEDPRAENWRLAGVIDESHSRDILNHILDIIAWD